MRLLLLVLLVALGACGTGEAASLSIATQAGTVTLAVEIADDRSERATGLMGRESLDPYDGMAFVWDGPVEGTFWMKGTTIPLSIAFWDEGGRIIEILDMQPCERDPCPSYGPGRPFVGAVEVRQGDFERRGVSVGDRVSLEVPDV